MMTANKLRTSAVLLLIGTTAASAAFAASLGRTCRAEAAQAAPARAVGGKTGADLMPLILEKARDYCRRLAYASLDFVCRETIDEKLYDPPLKLLSSVSNDNTHKATSTLLEYDYQLVRDKAAIVEKRELIRENGKERHEKNASLKTHIYKHKNMIFGPFAVLSADRQPDHVYTYLGEDTIYGEKAYVIDAAPSGDAQDGLLYGKVWVRAKDFAIIRIEWDQRSLGNFEKFRKEAGRIAADAAPRMTIACEYGIERNGLRFPSRLSVREDYESPRGVLRVSETTIIYKDYKFFTVETNVKF